MYSMERFLEHYSKSIGQATNQQIIDEVNYVEDNLQQKMTNRVFMSAINDILRQLAIKELETEIQSKKKYIADIKSNYTPKTISSEKSLRVAKTYAEIAELQKKLEEAKNPGVSKDGEESLDDPELPAKDDNDA